MVGAQDGKGYSHRVLKVWVVCVRTDMLRVSFLQQSWKILWGSALLYSQFYGKNEFMEHFALPLKLL